MAGNSLMVAMRLILLIPFLGALGYGLLMAKFSQEMQSGEPGFASEIVLKLGAAWFDYSVAKKRDAIVDVAVLNDERRVSLSRKVALTDLSGGSDGTLAGSRAEVAALVAAKQWGEAECDAMIRSFATRCGFGTADVQIGDDGLARLRVTLSFTNATPIGDTTGLDSAGLIPQRVDLAGPQGIEVAPADIPAERARLYAAADEACKGLRAEKGTCVISEIAFVEDPVEGGRVNLSASAEIAYLGQTVTAGEIADLTTRKVDGEASMLAFALKTMMAAQRSMTGTEAAEGDQPPPDAPPVDAKTLLDDVKLPRFEKSQGGAKFVSPP